MGINRTLVRSARRFVAFRSIGGAKQRKDGLWSSTILWFAVVRFHGIRERMMYSSQAHWYLSVKHSVIISPTYCCALGLWGFPHVLVWEFSSVQLAFDVPFLLSTNPHESKENRIERSKRSEWTKTIGGSVLYLKDEFTYEWSRNNVFQRYTSTERCKWRDTKQTLFWPVKRQERERELHSGSVILCMLLWSSSVDRSAIMHTGRERTREM